jgi:hypothetical protein
VHVPIFDACSRGARPTLSMAVLTQQAVQPRVPLRRPYRRVPVQLRSPAVLMHQPSTPPYVFTPARKTARNLLISWLPRRSPARATTLARVARMHESRDHIQITSGEERLG